MTAGLITLAAVLTAVAGALLLIHIARPQVRVPPAHPRRTVQETLDETGDQVDATVFAFPARPTNPGPDGDRAA